MRKIGIRLRRKEGRENKIRYRQSAGAIAYEVVIFIFLTLFSISLVLPLLWALMTAGKSVMEYTLNPFGWPSSYDFSNFAKAWQKLYVVVLTPKGMVRYGVDAMFLNTMILSTLPNILTVFFTASMAYILAKYKFIGSRFWHELGIVLIILPIIGNFPSTMQVMKQLGIYDNMLLLILKAPVGCFYGMNYLILRAMVQKLPDAYMEAAQIDGAGHFTVYFKIMLPMLLPTCFVFFLLSFMGGWGDYTTSLYWLPSKPTLGYGMYIFQNQAVQYNATVPEILCGFLILMIPTMLMYLVFQDLIISKMQVGGLKQ